MPTWYYSNLHLLQHYLGTVQEIIYFLDLSKKALGWVLQHILCPTTSAMIRFSFRRQALPPQPSHIFSCTSQGMQPTLLTVFYRKHHCWRVQHSPNFFLIFFRYMEPDKKHSTRTQRKSVRLKTPWTKQYIACIRSINFRKGLINMPGTEPGYFLVFNSIYIAKGS